MGKEALKKLAADEQQNTCALCGKPLSDKLYKIHTHRLVQRKDGGGYDRDNYIVVCPLCHFKRHGILRVRPEDLDELKGSVDSYRQALKLRCKIDNQKLAVEAQVDTLEPADEALFQEVGDRISFAEAERRKSIEDWFKKKGKDDLFVRAILSVKGVGPISAAELINDVDLQKADHASSLWKFVGYDTASVDRYKKGQEGGGRKSLRTALYNLGMCFLKSASPYAELYYQYKDRLANSEKITRERRKGDGKVVEIAWKEAMPIHRHLAAIRYMMKAYLADYWMVGRTLLGLPTNDLYVKEHLGHESAILDPKARGWEF